MQIALPLRSRAVLLLISKTFAENKVLKKCKMADKIEILLSNVCFQLERVAIRNFEIQKNFEYLIEHYNTLLFKGQKRVQDRE